MKNVSVLDDFPSGLEVLQHRSISSRPWEADESTFPQLFAAL